MALRISRFLFDKTKAPHKYYKYGYQPDPRKLAAADRVAKNELFPHVIRPPCAHARTHEEYLDRIDVSKKFPTSEFKSAFTSWDDLFTASRKAMTKRGVPDKVARYICWNRDLYNNGVMPDRFDAKAEQQYWSQFKTLNGAQLRIPELPEKYRPHQQGIDSQPLPNYEEMNRLPAWAQQAAAATTK